MRTRFVNPMSVMASIFSIAEAVCYSAIMPSSRSCAAFYINAPSRQTSKFQRSVRAQKRNFSINKLALADALAICISLRSSPIGLSQGAYGESLVQNGRRGFTTMMMALDDEEVSPSAKTAASVWNIPGLKKESARLTLRTHKKIGKVTTRFQKARALADDLMTNPDATLDELEACPNIEALQLELDQLRSRLSKLNTLEELLKTGVTKKKESTLPAEIADLVLDLGVNDEPPKAQPRGPKKKKGPKTEAKRQPFKRYYSANKTEIRVGKRAEDNDALSLRPEYRDGSDWWMHASGCPGSHVVIRCGDENLNEDVVKDAAALAARQSKCNGNTIKVSLTRCRNVSKPRGAKPGLVQLNGNIRTVSVNMKEAESRLSRLDKTVQVN